ncbi:hypothetical protein PIB30_030570 [Stylosanthes scabra]|uniref:Replication factor A C-terminal domain-containing protein n=1 Tax=Stylosanthes scabra TaxID=79078 RepID=A0ABU6TBA9_9FABA|nr:hypothetical protein [Stylosanthes scabra]
MAEARRIGQPSNVYDRVADINAKKLDWNLLVGVVRMYELPVPSNPSDFYQVDMILQDQEVCRWARIQCSVSKANFGFYKTLIHEFGVYNMREFLVQTPGRGVRTTSRNFRLSFYRKTSVRRVSMDAFPFSPILVTPFPGVLAMTEVGQFHLIDALFHVVGKEEVIDMVTRNGDASKRMAVHLEDLELLGLGDIATQGIAEVPTQSQNSATSELASGAINNDSIETVLSSNEVKQCWVLGDVVSIDCGAKGWYYASCRNCYKAVDDRKDVYKCANCGQIGSKPPLKYRLNAIITDETGCMNVLLWNSEAALLLGKTARDVKDDKDGLEGLPYPKLFDELLEKYLMKVSVERKNISNVDQVYSVVKVSEDLSFLDLYSSQRSMASDADINYSAGMVSLEANVVELSKKLVKLWYYKARLMGRSQPTRHFAVGLPSARRIEYVSERPIGRVLENQVPLPHLPDDLILEVFSRSDGKTVGGSRVLSRAWNVRLCSGAFVMMHLMHPSERPPSTFPHFGMKGPRSVGSWVMRFNTGTRMRGVLKMLFLRNN